ncbi:DddA-like double-stranded DNA deaminase toxin [Actinosynnema mirum]|uniref:DddA-like double-stranded DNA deaminase toxin n=1 Tax=Actinosynnema mirum TaxID=40567 RepID=UPI0002FC3EF7|nr:DddA-like double-stranded DNA deaminase toxin [Actinosynnema mirum]
MSLPEVAAALARVLALAAETAAALEVADERAGEMRALVERAAEGTAGEELELLRAAHASFAEDLAAVRAALAGGRESVESYRASLLTPPPRPAAPPTTRPKPLVARTGDAYPPGTEWALPLIVQPHPPVGGTVPVEGHVRALRPESQISHVFHPGGGHWTEQARARLRVLPGFGWAVNLGHHVELQIAAWMTACGIHHAELVLNRPPCGERYGLGCHQALPVLLPRGYRLTVSSTRGGPQPYQHHYEGKA